MAQLTAFFGFNGHFSSKRDKPSASPADGWRITIAIRKLADIKCSELLVTVCNVLVYVHLGRSQFRSLVHFTCIVTTLHQIRSQGTS